MPVLKPSDFVHGVWAVRRDGAYVDSTIGWVQNVLPSELAECGSRCCLVGNVRHAFGMPACPHHGGELVGPGLRFLRKLCENIGRPIGLESDNWPELQASDAFEGCNGNDPITGRSAARAWNKTIADFGYTEDA